MRGWKSAALREVTAFSGRLTGRLHAFRGENEQHYCGTANLSTESVDKSVGDPLSLQCFQAKPSDFTALIKKQAISNRLKLLVNFLRGH